MPAPDLDITALVCPMTFVHVRLMVDRAAPGAEFVIRLNAGEAMENVPRSLAELGHRVVPLGPEDPAAPDGPQRIAVTVA